MRKPLKLPTVSVSVCLKRDVRESLGKLSAVRKLKLPAAAAPLSVVGIVDQAILDFDTYLKTAEDVAFLPVPASDYIRVSLRVSERLRPTVFWMMPWSSLNIGESAFAR